MTTQQEALSAKFDESVHRSMLKGGTRLTYIPVAAVIQRLNEVLGVDAWSLKIVSVYRDATDPDFIVAQIMLTAEFEREVVTRDAVGGQRIKRTRDGGIIDLGDEMKGAVSDALKKAAQTLGVGLYLTGVDDHHTDTPSSAPVRDSDVPHPAEVADIASKRESSIHRPITPKQIDFINSLASKCADVALAQSLINWDDLNVFTAGELIDRLRAMPTAKGTK
jgi:hypothetical protein